MDNEELADHADWVYEHQEVDADFSMIIFISNEANFHMCVFVNKQNCCIWANINSRVIHRTIWYPQKVTVSCSIWFRGEIGHYLFEINKGKTVTINGVCYRRLGAS